MEIKEKLVAVLQSPEVEAAMAILVAAFKDCELNSHLRGVFVCDDGRFELTLLKLRHQIDIVRKSPTPAPPDENAKDH